MAPEILEGKKYKGTEVDIFSIGVSIFCIVLGILPFSQARKNEYFYNMLYTGATDRYFAEIKNRSGFHNLSDEFIDLFE